MSGGFEQRLSWFITSLTHGLEEFFVVLLGVDLPCSIEVHVVGLVGVDSSTREAADNCVKLNTM